MFVALYFFICRKEVIYFRVRVRVRVVRVLGLGLWLRC